MSVNKPDEWTEFRKWLGLRIEKSCDADSAGHEVLRGALDDGGAATAVAELERLVVTAATAEEAVRLRHDLALALAAQAVEVRGVTRDGALVIIERSQLVACEGCAVRILALHTSDPELTGFATELLERVRAGRVWEWAALRAATGFAVVVLLLGVLPVIVGGLLGSTPAVVFGVVVGAALVFLFVLRHRRQRWTIDAEAVAPLVWRRGR